MINYIWGFFIIIGLLYSFIMGVNINTEILSSVSGSLDLILTLLPIMCLWLGIMNIANDSGLIDKLSKKIRPLLKIIFPSLSGESKSISYIATSIIMNVLGLGNAGTPFGLKAMKELQKENNNSNVASDSMITFLVITTASVTLIPTTVIGIRMAKNSTNPTDIIIPCIIVSFLSLIFGLFINKIFIRIGKKNV